MRETSACLLDALRAHGYEAVGRCDAGVALCVTRMTEIGSPLYRYDAPSGANGKRPSTLSPLLLCRPGGVRWSIPSGPKAYLLVS